MFELGLRNITLGARDFASAVSGFCQVFIVTRAPSANTEHSRRAREKPLVPRVRWSFHMWLFSRVKISCFRAKAHLVFHWCLYNKVLFVLRWATIQTCTPVLKAMFFTIFCGCCFALFIHLQCSTNERTKLNISSRDTFDRENDKICSKKCPKGKARTGHLNPCGSNQGK